MKPKSNPFVGHYVQIFLIAFFIFNISVLAQDKTLVHIKTFDQQLHAYRNLEISINGKEYISTGNKGEAFMELPQGDLPPKTVKIKNDKLEAASWNYTKGVLEIIVRNKSYRVVSLSVKDENGSPLDNIPVTFNGKRPATLNTDGHGQVEFAVPLEEKITSANQFLVNGYKVEHLDLSEHENVLFVSSIKPEVVPQPEMKAEQPKKNEDYFKDFELSRLDSIQSLTVFYAVFRNVQMKNLSEAARRKLDDKFNSLMIKLQDSLKLQEKTSMTKISDSSFVGDDIKNLLAQADEESQVLDAQQVEFQARIQMLKKKLEGGVANMDDATRSRLLSDIARLEQLLVDNARKFYRNQNEYKQIINSLKETFFDFEGLENKLSESEAQRLEEQRIFRRQIMIIGSIAVVFGIMLILLITFSRRLKKRKQELEAAKAEVERINVHLEDLVSQRTFELEEANKELDTFLYRASHDLRSPVCSIIGLCHIANQTSGEETKELLVRMVTTISAMDRLLKKLSLISEINQPSGFKRINLRRTVDDLLYGMSKMARENNIKVTTNCPGNITIQSYPIIVESILSNLIENAIFFTALKNGPENSVDISASVDDGQLQISVSDNGVGIDASYHERVFDMFFKGDEYSKGNGLGLYIVRKSVEALDGRISLESIRGQYTRFTITLPTTVNDAHVVDEMVG